MTLDTTQPLAQRLDRVRQRIQDAEIRYHRPAGSVRLLAVSKTRHAHEIRATAALGQLAFGESYLQEALEKMAQLQDMSLEWHYIGRLQSNKTKQVAERFHWVHSISSLKHAQRLSLQRPSSLPPLNICIQVNTSGEDSKGGHAVAQLPKLLPQYAELPNLRVQGLMAIPAAAEGLDAQRQPFKFLRQLRDKLSSDELPLETLSMGMSADLEAAIAEGATIIRIGTAIFGPRRYNVKN